MDSKRKKYRLFYKLEEQLEVPMFLLAIVWLFFFILELVNGLSPTQEIYHLLHLDSFYSGIRSKALSRSEKERVP